MYKEFATVYDQLAGEKEYPKETAYALSFLGSNPSSILDIGCGTGNHLVEFRKMTDASLLGIDPCPEMIKQVTKKSIVDCISTVMPACDPFEGVRGREGTFDLVTSYFNVINHIHTLPELVEMFDVTFTNLCSGGVFVFDCWNGAAFFNDPPVAKSITTPAGNYHYSYPSDDCILNLLDSNIEMEVTLETFEGELVSSKLLHTLWTPFMLKSLLNSSGFEDVKIYKPFSREEATGLEHKLSFVCRK